MDNTITMRFSRPLNTGIGMGQVAQWSKAPDVLVRIFGEPPTHLNEDLTIFV